MLFLSLLKNLLNNFNVNILSIFFINQDIILIYNEIV